MEYMLTVNILCICISIIEGQIRGQLHNRIISITEICGIRRIHGHIVRLLMDDRTRLISRMASRGKRGKSEKQWTVRDEAERGDGVRNRVLTAVVVSVNAS